MEFPLTLIFVSLLICASKCWNNGYWINVTLSSFRKLAALKMNCFECKVQPNQKFSKEPSPIWYGELLARNRRTSKCSSTPTTMITIWTSSVWRQWTRDTFKSLPPMEWLRPQASTTFSSMWPTARWAGRATNWICRPCNNYCRSKWSSRQFTTSFVTTWTCALPVTPQSGGTGHGGKRKSIGWRWKGSTCH